MQGRSRSQQQKVVREVLLSMLPPGAPEQKLFQPTKWAAEFNAALTVPFFHWLVGPSEVEEVEINGVKQSSGVHIKKCRWNYFIFHYIPGEQWAADFEDRNCEMVYGKVPPPFEEDPVSKEPCFTGICSIANPSSSVSPKLQN
ncbi:hypothetical protein ACFX13_039206 [Malus domestica]